MRSGRDLCSSRRFWYARRYWQRSRSGYPYSLAAAAGAVMLLLIGGVATERILEGVDWTLLLFFAGLFVVMHGVEVSGWLLP